MRRTLISIVMFIVPSTSAIADNDLDGEYACTVQEKAGIASIHLEAADPPKAYMEHDIQSTFGMRIEKILDGKFEYQITETEDSGENPDLMDYHTQFSVLHNVYYGDGFDFTAAEDQAFLRLHHQSDGRLYFYHAGFEYPGGVDVRLSTRFGECKLKR